MERKVDIDILLGLGIFSVVTGHLVPGITAKIIFLYHMPLFFIVSGYLNKIHPDKARFFGKKFFSLLLPYFTYLIIFKIKEIQHVIHMALNSEFSGAVILLLNYSFALFWGGQELKQVVGIFWFITCLFVTQQIYNYVFIALKKNRNVIALSIVFYILAVVNQYFFSQYGFIWNINVVLCSLPLYAIGNIFGDHLFRHKINKMNFFALIVAIVSIILIYFKFKLSFNMKYSYYGWFIISPLAAISITKLLSMFSCKMLNIKYIGRLLAASGQASLTIMYTHQFIHYKFINYSNEHPWLMTFSIFATCLLFHYLVSTNIITRILLLGSRQDLKILKDKLFRQKKIEFV